MAQWIHMSQMIQRLSDETVNNLYPPTAFPIEVRHFLAEWIESQRWDDFALEKVELESQAQTLLDQTISMLQSISQQNANVVDKLKLMQISRNMTMLNQQPLRFAVMVKEILTKERALLGTLPQTPSSTPQYQQHQNRENSFPSMQDVDHLVLKVLEVQDIRQKMHQLQEELNWERQNFEGLQGPIQQNGMDPKNSEIQKLQNHIQQLEYNVKALATKRFQLLKECVDILDQCQTRLISRLKAWRWEQHKATIGHPFDENLHPLQTWCEQLLGVNGKLRQELMLIGEPIPELQERLGKLLQVLIQSSLMVEKQPPQVIKTQSKFCTTVRYLLGEKVASGKPVVLKAQIMNEMQARNLGSVPGDNVGELINNTAILEHNAVSKSTCATFRNMSIKKIKRADRRGSESVTEEKFALLFSAEITITGCDTPYRIQMISLPVVVIVHGSQDNNALATIIWDCAFSESDRVPFMVPERVPWRMMYSTLNSKFTSEVQTNHNLDHYNQHFLAQKIFDKPDFAEDFSNILVSWGQFNKEVLPGRTFTFWQWFEGVMDLSKKHLKTYWSEGLIFGFIGKQHLHLILKDRPNGTFLLRFSDSEIGGITIAYVSATENGGQKIQNIQPFTKRDLDIRNLGDRIRDINDITYLYPAFPKDEVFKRFYSEPRASPPGGYIPVSLQTRVGTEGREGSSAIPLTPSMTPIAVSPASNIYPVNQFQQPLGQQEQDMEGGPSGEFSGFNDQASANMEIDFESLLENLPE
ncbi:signal transducer and activator of transcription 6 [Notothenia coriiceps]|uniref:Signal transducer and activator of transcription n=1 Tax=Notothenia coriiceps TaxID=8208 RepID=A0A6I9Q2R8_9TELE|nr:PREDICTED: signal transducer and activator of transcription 6-like [Notothenia coriiceps]XP_010795328.1 PREDICTED: signal transducer and activator of transcription 6-like [Notothenia coriiceps]